MDKHRAEEPGDPAVEEFEVEPVPEPDEPEEGVVDRDDTYSEGST